MNKHQKNNITTFLLFIALLPFYIGFFSYLVGVCLDKNVVITALPTPTSILLALGTIACISSYKNLPYHRCVVLIVSLVFLAYLLVDFYRSFGVNVAEKLTLKIKVLSILLDKHNYITLFSFAIKDFISPILLSFLVIKSLIKPA